MAAEDVDDMPAALRVLWGLGDAPARGQRPGLSLDRIVTAAVEIADADGIAGLSMARIAQRLGCATMSLYRHVASKDELQMFMLDAASGPPPDLGAGGWRARLDAWARALREVYLRHPWILQVSTGRPPLEPGQLGWLDRGLAALDGTALSPHDRLSAVLLVLNYVRGDAQIAAILLRGDGEAGFGAGAAAAYARTLAQLVTADRFPALAEAIDAGVFAPMDGAGAPADDFEFGLARILDGIEAVG